MRTLQLTICFFFVSTCFARGDYSGRKRGIKMPPSGIRGVGSNIMGLHASSMGMDVNVISSSMIGRSMVPRHPIIRGMNPVIGGMTSLVGRTNIVHEVDKAGASGLPALGQDHLTAQTGHISAKNAIGQAASIVDQQTFGGVSRGDPMANDIAADQALRSLHVAKKTVGQARNNAAAIGSMGVAHVGAFNSGMPITVGNPMMGADPVGHMVAKSSTGTHIGLSGLSSGMLGRNPVGHNIQKATLGMDQMAGHNIAKSAAVMTGTGILNAGVPMGGAGMIGGPLGGAVIGGPIERTNVVHEVNMASMSGIPSIGAHPIAARAGHVAAKQAVGHAAAVIDRDTFGGVSRGELIPNRIAADLTRDAMHVGSKTVDMAAARIRDSGMGMESIGDMGLRIGGIESMGMGGMGSIGIRRIGSMGLTDNMIGGQVPMMKPVKPAMSGYGRRKG